MNTCGAVSDLADDIVGDAELTGGDCVCPSLNSEKARCQTFAVGSKQSTLVLEPNVSFE
jgi:hypothetical protein